MRVSNLSLSVLALVPALVHGNIRYYSAPAYQSRPHYDGREITDEQRRVPRFPKLQGAPKMQTRADSHWIDRGKYDQHIVTSDSPRHDPSQMAEYHYERPPPRVTNTTYVPYSRPQARPYEQGGAYSSYSSLNTPEGSTNAIGQAPGSSYENIRAHATTSPLYTYPGSGQQQYRDGPKQDRGAYVGDAGYTRQEEPRGWPRQDRRTRSDDVDYPKERWRAPQRPGGDKSIGAALGY